MKREILSILFILLLVASLFSQRAIDPRKEIYSYKIIFESIAGELLPDSVETRQYSELDSATFQWLAPLFAMPLDSQPDPFVFGSGVTYKVLTIPNAEVSYDSVIISSYRPMERLEPGSYQIYITASIQYELPDTVVRRWSKASDAIGLRVLQDQYPPEAPAEFKIKFY